MAIAQARRYTLHTLRKGLAVLEALGAVPEMTLTELSRRLDESPTVVFRLLRTLEEEGYVRQSPASKRYSLGLRLWEIGCKAASRTGLTEAARPVLKWLAEVTGETADIAVLRGTDIVYLSVVEGREPLRVYNEPGSRMPAYVTASGRAILAFRGPKAWRQVEQAGMPRCTPATITKPRPFRRRLLEIRQAGISVMHGERLLHVSAVAAPILGEGGECLAAVGVSGPSLRFQDERLARIEESVRKAAEEISAKLGMRVPDSRPGEPWTGSDDHAGGQRP
jgi:DNA-binding IclR family transcriptional regulator